MKIIDYLKLRYWDYKNPRPERLKDVDVFCADTGEGKTVSMVYYAQLLKKQFDAKLFSNCGIKNQDGEIKSVEDMIATPHNSIICLDEINNIMNCQKWKDVDPAIFSILTQHRHLWKKVICTAQNFDEMHIGFRRHANIIIDVNNWGGRWFFWKAYKRSGFIQLQKMNEQTHSLEFIEEFENKKILWRNSFVATNEIFDLYDTYELVDFLTSSKTDVKEFNLNLVNDRKLQLKQVIG